MPQRGRPSRSVALTVLRAIRGWNKKELAAAAGRQPDLISNYERGKKTPSLATLQRLAGVMGFPAGLVEEVLKLIDGARPAEEVAGAPGKLEPKVRRRIEELAAEHGRTMAAHVRSELTRSVMDGQVEDERQHARELWARLAQYSRREQRTLFKYSEEFRSWALCELLCAESVKAAADSAKRAVELADLAVEIAHFVPGEQGWRSEVEAYCLAHVGNARRVAGNLPAAEDAFARAGTLRPGEEPGEPGPLDGSRVLDLEASLRQAQRRFPEALSLLGRALPLARNDAAKGRLLIIRAKTLEEAGDYDEAVATLQRAARLVEGQRDLGLLWALRFNVLVNLCHLGRHGDAEPLLPELRDLAARRANGLDQVRLRWLEGRIAAGLGRHEEAVETLTRVRGEFATREIAYETALSTLELAVLHFEQGRAGEVRVLARQMAWIFRAQGVPRETLAALYLFRRAAEAETATTELARRLLAFLRRAQHDPRLCFEE